MDNKIVGYIYIATNGSCVLENGEVKELVKIGYTDQHRLKDRMGEISKGSGVIAQFHAYAVYGVYERLVDINFGDLIKKLNPSIRYNPDREFYTMSPKQAYEIFECIAKINGLEGNLEKNPLKDEYIDKLINPTKTKNNNETIDSITLYITAHETDAICKTTDKKNFTLLKGSLVSKTITRSCPKPAKERREKCEKDGLIDKNYKTTKDLLFTSPSAVAYFVTGDAISGPRHLKNKDGKSLNELKTN